MTTPVFFVAMLFGVLLLMIPNRSGNSGGSNPLPWIVIGLGVLLLLAAGK